jgi:hypothetical protein
MIMREMILSILGFSNYPKTSLMIRRSNERERNLLLIINEEIRRREGGEQLTVNN